MTPSLASACKVNSAFASLFRAKFNAGLGRANERVGRVQESYVQTATTSWLDSLERSLTQMKEYNVGAPFNTTKLSSNLFTGRTQEA